MTEHLEPRTIEKPAFLELPEEQTLFWVCYGHVTLDNQSLNDNDEWHIAYTTKEEAEAAASSRDYCSNWIWDKTPAETISIYDLMFEARKDGSNGVQIDSYINGEWKAVKVYPASVPLNFSDK